PSSKARRAAATARSASATVARGKRPISASLAGESTGSVCPLAGATHSPPRKSRSRTYMVAPGQGSLLYTRARCEFKARMSGGGPHAPLPPHLRRFPHRRAPRHLDAADAGAAPRPRPAPAALRAGRCLGDRGAGAALPLRADAVRGPAARGVSAVGALGG